MSGIANVSSLGGTNELGVLPPRQWLREAEAAGFPPELLVPVAPPSATTKFLKDSDRGKVPATYRRDQDGDYSWIPVAWRDGVSTRAWDESSKAGANVGLRMGTPFAGLQYVFMDIDPIVDEADVGPLTDRAGLFSNEIVGLVQGLVAEPLWVRSSRKGRAGILFVLPETETSPRKLVTKYTDRVDGDIGKIEILACGQQAVIGGVHASGRDIAWRRHDSGEVHSFPPVNELPRLADFDELVAILDIVTQGLGARGVVGERSKARAEQAGGSTALVAPEGGVADLVTLLEALPHDGRVRRGPGDSSVNWVEVMLAVVGSLRACAAKETLNPSDVEAVKAAACNWGAKWPGSDWTQESDKWDRDWSQRDEIRVSWPYLVHAAEALGDDTWRLSRASAGFLRVVGEPMPPPTTDDRLPQCLAIEVGADMATTARQVLTRLANARAVYDFGGILSKIEKGERGAVRVQTVRADHIPHIAAPFCRMVKADPKGKLFETTMPKDMRALVLSAPADGCGVPRLIGIAAAPALTAEGGIRTDAGYDPASGLYALSLPALAVPEAPTAKQAQAALLVLRAALQTFPFGDATTSDDGRLGVPVVDLRAPPATAESCALIALMTAICRPSLPLAPGLMVTAPEGSGSGAGKGLLVRTIAAIAFGCEPRAFNAGRTPEEMDKRLGAELLCADPILLLDNVNATALRSDVLASVLTEVPVRIRLLGASTMATLSAKTFVAVTGNGLAPSEDLVRRFILCRLDAKVENPSARPFLDGQAEFLAKIGARRGELLTAALTIWRWGRQNASTLGRGLPIGSYETWGRWCRDPLLALGCQDPIEQIAETRAADPYRLQLEAAFGAWWRVHGCDALRAADVADSVRAAIDPHGRSPQSFAATLARLRGTRSGGWVMEHVEGSKARKAGVTYRLRWTGDGGAPARESVAPEFGGLKLVA